jgi:hypothetical protein
MSLVYVLRGLTWNNVLVFLDDAKVLGQDLKDNLAILMTVNKLFRRFDFKFKPKKSALFQTCMEFLGHRSQDGE